jgi:gliding motility-associated-like protein
MRIGKHIVLSGLILMLWSLFAGAQDPQWTVCAGDTGIAYYVSGWDTSTFDWTVEGGTITRNYGDTIIVNWPDEPGSYTITVQETSEYGCAGELKSGVVHVVSPSVDLGGDTYVCEGDYFELEPAGNFMAYLWQDGSTGSTYSTDQEGWITLQVTDAGGCTARDSLYLSVYDLPVVDLGPDTVVCGDTGVDLDAGSEGISYNWSTGDMSQLITVFYGGEEEIWVQVEDEYGCVSSDTVLVHNCSVEFFFRDIPTAITPSDGNGLNDFWEISQLESFPQAVVEIFDRWGTLVWRSEPGYSSPWDGRNMRGGEVPMDSYHFVIDLNTGNKKDVITGIITVIR